MPQRNRVGASARSPRRRVSVFVRGRLRLRVHWWLRVGGWRLAHLDECGADHAVVEPIAALELRDDPRLLDQVALLFVEDRLVEVGIEILAEGLDRAEATALKDREELLPDHR